MIYLDHNATTLLHPAARAAMAAAQGEPLGNPSSLHGPGRAARDALERARGEVARLCGVRGEEIVFCSGGTEGDNLAVRGAAHAARAATGRDEVISSPLEHPAVRASLDVLAREGFRITLLPVASDGAIDPDDLRRCAGSSTALITLAAANHEIGACYPIAAFCAIAHAAGALFHTDAVQAAGRMPLDLATLGVDLATISSHKLYGPPGAGALFLRRGLDLAPLLVGGHQERGRRPGTENLPGVIGFGAACVAAGGELAASAARIGALRDRLEAGAIALGARRFGPEVGRVPGTANLGFAGVDGELLMMNLDLAGVAVSTGAACSSGSLDPSPVILALGVTPAEARQAVRFSLGRENSAAEVDRVLALLPPMLARIRAA
ncbi:MAG: cysteine desulfurase [Myxococcales bacterium]|nr:cysteine desulfurase [Myxococcales bacterium]